VFPFSSVQIARVRPLRYRFDVANFSHGFSNRMRAGRARSQPDLGE